MFLLKTLVFLLSVILVSSEKFRNPLLIGADPHVLRLNGQYYVLTTRQFDIAIYGPVNSLNDLDSVQPVRVWYVLLCSNPQIFSTAPVVLTPHSLTQVRSPWTEWSMGSRATLFPRQMAHLCLTQKIRREILPHVCSPLPHQLPLWPIRIPWPPQCCSRHRPPSLQAPGQHLHHLFTVLIQQYRQIHSMHLPCPSNLSYTDRRTSCPSQLPSLLMGTTRCQHQRRTSNHHKKRPNLPHLFCQWSLERGLFPRHVDIEKRRRR